MDLHPLNFFVTLCFDCKQKADADQKRLIDGMVGSRNCFVRCCLCRKIVNGLGGTIYLVEIEPCEDPAHYVNTEPNVSLLP